MSDMNERLAAGFHRLLAPVWARREAKRQATWEALNHLLCTGLTPEGLEAARVYAEDNSIFSRPAMIFTEIPPEDFYFRMEGNEIVEAGLSKPSPQSPARTDHSEGAST